MPRQLQTRHQQTSRPQADHLAPRQTDQPSPAVSCRQGRGGGTALDRKTSREMSARFGHDFSHVRIHTDSRAGQAAEAAGANAYALGGDIVFGAGKYQPGSRETERLLAHELTHVAQQDRFGPGDWGRASGRGDASEREADSLASQVMLGRSVRVRAAPDAALARDEAPDSNGPPASFQPQEPNQSVEPNQSFQPTPMAGDPQPQPARPATRSTPSCVRATITPPRSRRATPRSGARSERSP